MDLRTIVENKFINQVLRVVKSNTKWKVLVLDSISARVISTCSNITELVKEDVVLIENLDRKREVVPYEAIYFVTPIVKSVHEMIDDFKKGPMYEAAHIFMTDSCPDALFDELRSSAIFPYVKTFIEINMTFLVHESIVFLLNYPNFFERFYARGRHEEHLLQKVADQLASLCFTLNEFPSIRYGKNFAPNRILAKMVEEKLNSYKKDNMNLGETTSKAKSVLIILDRGYDMKTPFLHELTYQAMAYDLCNITKNTYHYDEGANKETILDENDEFWNELRHDHIATVTQTVTEKFEKFKKDKNISGNSTNMRDLSAMMKRMPEYQKELKNFVVHFSLASECMDKFQMFIDKLCEAEQDLATGTDSNQDFIKDPLKKFIPVLLNPHISENDKIRLIILYVLNQGSVTDENLKYLLHHAQIGKVDLTLIHRMEYLGFPIMKDSKTRPRINIPRKPRNADNYFNLSRWVPYLKDVLEDTIDGRLDVNHFPFYFERAAPRLNQQPIVTSLRQQTKDVLEKDMSRLIIFMVGGISYSEIRTVYEVSEQYNPNWQVIIGSDSIVTPAQLIANLRHIK